jgi:hypothetical protein
MLLIVRKSLVKPIIFLLYTQTLSYWIVSDDLQCTLFHSLILWNYSRGRKLQNELTVGFHYPLRSSLGSYLSLISKSYDIHYGPQWLVKPAVLRVCTVFGAVSRNMVRWTDGFQRKGKAPKWRARRGISVLINHICGNQLWHKCTSRLIDSYDI